MRFGDVDTVIETEKTEFVLRPAISGVREVDLGNGIVREGFEDISMKDFFIHDNGGAKCRSHQIRGSK